MKKKLLFLPLIGLLLTGCSLEDLMFWKKSDEQGQKDTPKDEDKPSGEGEHVDPPVIEDEYTATIQTSGSSFEAQFPGGSHFDTEQKQTALKTNLSSQLEYPSLIKSISCTNLHSQTYSDVTYMQFGSGNGIGSFAMQSDTKIYKVSVKVLCYAKYDSYHEIYNIDFWSHFLINDQDNDMTYDGATQPSVMTFEKTFASGTNTINLSSKDGRVFLKEMTITWGN